MKTMENLLKCNGRRFRAKIQGVECEGRISVEHNMVHLCQDKRQGAACKEKYGYKYSWFTPTSESGEILSFTVTDLQLLPITAADIDDYRGWQVGDKIANAEVPYIWEVIFRGGEAVICKDEDGNVCCTATCEQLHRDGWRLVVEEESNVHKKANSCTDAAPNVHGSGEMCIYQPKVGDLVYASAINRRQASIYLFEAYSPSVHRGFNSKGWTFSAGTIANVEFIRPASDKEAALFTRILAENGYEYDPEKKEVRKKRQRRKRAELAGRFYFINSDLSVSYTRDCRLESDERRYQAGNYFLTLEEAEEVAANFREILRNR